MAQQLDILDANTELPPTKPIGRVTRIQEKCVECGKVAEEAYKLDTKNKDGVDVQLVVLKCGHSITKIIAKQADYESFMTFEHKHNECKHEWTKNLCTTCGAYKLFPFQVIGARFIERAVQLHKGAGVFDEKGLGKTIQPLAFLNYHPEAFPALFIVKSKLKFQFFKEIIRWLGPSHLAQIIETGKDPILPNLKCYIIGYDMLRRFDCDKLVERGIKTIILDECQQIKNPDAKRTREVRIIAETVDNIIPTSATPWKNRGSELYVALNLIAPTMFPTQQGFVDRWVDYYSYGEGYKEGGIRNPKKFREYTKDILIRREAKEVTDEFPEINRTLHYCKLDGAAEQTYNDEVSAFVKWYNSKVIGGEEDSFDTASNILAKMQRMRHITGLAKIGTTVEFIREHIEETNEKIVVFVHHQDVGELLYRQCVIEFKDIPLFKFTAGLDAMHITTKIQDPFNETDGPAIMVASTLAAGEGLNLGACGYCIMHERQWNPGDEEQPEGRFTRIVGSKFKIVNSTYMTAEGTIDDHMAGLVEEKRNNFHAVMNNGEMPVWNRSEIIKDLAELIVKDASKLEIMTKW